MAATDRVRDLFFGQLARSFNEGAMRRKGNTMKKVAVLLLAILLSTAVLSVGASDDRVEPSALTAGWAVDGNGYVIVPASIAGTVILISFNLLKGQS